MIVTMITCINGYNPLWPTFRCPTRATSGNFQKSIRSAMLQVNDRRRKPY